MNESRWEHALHATKGLGDWRRDITILLAVAAVMFVALRLFAPGSVGGNLLYSLLVGFGVLVLVPLFELLWHYRKAPSAPPGPSLEAPREAEVPGPDQAEREEELRERFRRSL